MPWAPAIQLSERLDRIEWYRYFAESFVVLADSADFGQMQQGIEQHGGVPGRKHKTVAVRPHGILRIEAQELLPEGVRHRRHTHGRSGMSRIRGLHCIDAQGADRVDTGEVHVLLHWG